VSDSSNGERRAGASTATTRGVDSSEWTLLRDARIYFGHQSVGGNIVEGLRETGIAGESGPLTIVRSRERGAGPALQEFQIGENGRPESKIADFAAVLQQVADPDGGVAVFKYCYLDIGADTDVDRLFARHRDAVREMRSRNPMLTFVHVTAPLTTLEAGPRYLVKRVLGKPTTRDANTKRNAFNEMLRKEYAGEPIFDLARVESTRPDGTRSFFTANGDTVYTLSPEFTEDGGHLNAAGRRAAALEFAAVLASARRRATPAAAR
jgi:hypothetical protein